MTHQLPAALAPLAAYRQFILCQLVPDPSRPGKTLKYPLHPTTLHRHNAHDPCAWLSYGEAAALAETCGDGYAVGFTFTAELGLFFIDIDNCLTDAGEWSQVAQQLCARLAGAAVEVSQSGRGLHIIGTLPAGRPDHGCRNSALGLEAYTGERFMVLGSDAVGSAACAPVAILDVLREYFPAQGGADGEPDDWTDAPVAEWSGEADDAALLRRAMASGSAAGAFGGRASFADLWSADAAALGRTWPDDAGDRAYDASQADGALAGHLAFWTGKNCARIEKLMRESALMREKWDRADGRYGTYLRRTIIGAVARCSAVYGERQAAPLKANQINNLQAESGGEAAPLSFTAAAGGMIAATVANVESALLADESGVTVAVDEFRKRICIREGDTWRLFKDTDYGRLRSALEKRGFKPVPAEVIKTVVGMVADQRRFDSAHDRVAGLVWDKIPRVTTALRDYYGVADSAYTRAASEYLFTALAGRSLQPGIKADMALILIGLQGARKTSAVEVLALEDEHFGAVDLSKLDDELARKIRGKTVIEWAELRGLAGRDKESIKDWLSRRKEEFRDLYVSFPEPYQRRCIVVATGNEEEILDDPTGERRSLPMIAGTADVEGLRGVMEQLWAEGAVMFRNGGIRWQEAERLARAEHGNFKVVDIWTEQVAAWLDDCPIENGIPENGATNGDRPVSLLDVLKKALNCLPQHMGKAEQNRAAKIMKSLGYVKKNITRHGKQAKRWVKG